MYRKKLLLLAALISLALAASQGCVERELFIKSDPPGAMVFVDGIPRAVTPLSVPFDSYGTRDIELRLGNYKVHCEQIDVNPPWYMIFPLDFFSEVLIPFTCVDSHVIDVKLEKIPDDAFEDQEEILKRARTLRESS